MIQWITVLGATGSIGKSTLDVIARHPERYGVFALTAHTQVQALLTLCLTHQPKYAVMADAASAEQLAQALTAHKSNCQVLSGERALSEVCEAPEVDQVMAAIVGAAGLMPTLSAAKAGKRILLANKEALVMSGQLFMETVKQSGSTLMPIDSEHNAIFQSLPSNRVVDSSVEKILLTASGGPFRGYSRDQLANITPAQAVKHPNWSMGQKISVDSASLMNKGLELIEACWLFNVLPEQIDVVIHPESIIHSMVRYNDGSVIAQMGNPDMRTPIAYGLAWPERIDSGVEPLDFFKLAQLNFQAPDYEVFPALSLSSKAFKQGGTTPAVLNAANEIAVASFLQEQISFLRISELVDDALQHHQHQQADSIESVLHADMWARHFVQERIKQ